MLLCLVPIVLVSLIFENIVHAPHFTECSKLTCWLSFFLVGFLFFEVSFNGFILFAAVFCSFYG